MKIVTVYGCLDSIAQLHQVHKILYFVIHILCFIVIWACLRNGSPSRGHLFYSANEEFKEKHIKQSESVGIKLGIGGAVQSGRQGRCVSQCCDVCSPSAFDLL